MAEAVGGMCSCCFLDSRNAELITAGIYQDVERQRVDLVLCWKIVFVVVEKVEQGLNYGRPHVVDFNNTRLFLLQLL